MAALTSDRIRNVAIVGQADSGKTTLVESIVFEAGSLSRKGRVEDGTTISDFDPEEITHHHSISLSLCSFNFGDFKVNLLDTPGVSDFVGEVQGAFAACELAVFVVSGVGSVGPDTLRVWKMAEALKLPRMVFLNKMDKEMAHFETKLAELRSLLGNGVTPIEVPIGREAGFIGVADLFNEEAITYASGRPEHSPIPPEVQAQEQSEHEHLLEGIVVSDETLLERYLEGAPLDPQQLETLLGKSVQAGETFPVICGSSTKQIGIDQLLRFICELGPPPKHGEISPQTPFVGQIIKTFSDQYLGRLSMVKIHEGVLNGDCAVHNVTRGCDEKLHAYFSRRGKEALSTAGALTGDIIVVPKLVSSMTSDTLAADPECSPIPQINFVNSTYSVVVNLNNSSDDEKAYGVLAKLCEEDPTLHIGREHRSHKIRLTGQGETHISNALAKMRRRTPIEVTTSEPEIEYLQTISRAASAEGRYKKQSGGHGQFGVAYLELEPLSRGSGFEFVDEVVGGAIPRNFIPAVEKGVVEAMSAGGASGYPVTDIRVRLYDGKFHPVDSSELSFKMAGALAFRSAFEQGDPQLLEPINLIEVYVPESYQGDVLGDLASKRAKVLHTETFAEERTTKITALAPESELRRYTVELRAMTAGQGKFQATHAHYERCPS